MNVSVVLGEEEVQRIARAVAAVLAGSQGQRWLTVREAAEYCGMSQDAIRAAEKRGQVSGYRGETGRLRFRSDDLDRFLGMEPER